MSNAMMRRAAPSVPSEREIHTGYVYGDSTPFPHEGNFIETVRHAIDCGASLLTAQHAIERAMVRSAEIERARHVERARLSSMSTSLKRALAADMATTSERVLRTGARILDAGRATIEAEIAALDTMAGAELARARVTSDEAKAVAKRAIETFLTLHDLPGTALGLRMNANEEDYAAQTILSTPFGVDAVFELAIPPAHEWGKPKRVVDLAAGTEVHVPLESGLFFKKVAVQPVKLDRLFVSSVVLSVGRSTLTLRKQPNAGSGYKLELDASQDPPRVLLTKIDEDGMDSPEPAIELSGEDDVHVTRLWARVLDSTGDLPMRRHKMVRASVDGMPIDECDSPRTICEKLVRVLAPIVREISRRSGAPGELVLRRDVRAGRRDEVYITKAELYEKAIQLPPQLRAVFDPLELDSPRSPRAPAPSVSSYEELSQAELIATVDAAPALMLTS